MKITVAPRIHMGLISMHEDAPRLHGGIGFAVDDPCAVCSFDVSDKNQIIDKRVTPLTARESEKIISVLDAARTELKLSKGVKCHISGELRTHHGMGSGTGIRLACLEGLLRLNGQATDQEVLQSFSKRGGVSGIGINTYFGGKLVFDLGIKNAGEGFTPSHAKESPALPLIAGIVSMPEWGIGICIDPKIPALTQEQELAFFNNTAPLPAAASSIASYNCLFGVYASVLEQDKTAFDAAIRALQNDPWKAAERELYGAPVLDMEQELYNAGADAVGMSSLGPLLYFTFGAETASKEIQDRMQESGKLVYITEFNNIGRTVSE